MTPTQKYSIRRRGDSRIARLKRHAPNKTGHFLPALERGGVMLAVTEGIVKKAKRRNDPSVFYASSSPLHKGAIFAIPYGKHWYASNRTGHS